jgi:hypothetical protein
MPHLQRLIFIQILIAEKYLKRNMTRKFSTRYTMMSMQNTQIVEKFITHMIGIWTLSTHYICINDSNYSASSMTDHTHHKNRDAHSTLEMMTYGYSVRFQVLMAASMNITVLWDVASHSLV